MNFERYNPQSPAFFDEMFASSGVPRAGFEPLIQGINSLPAGMMHRRQELAERALLTMGITFTLRTDENEPSERIFPFDIIPRIVRADEWQRVEAGLKQRLIALNLFLEDVYGDQRVLKDGVVPRELVETCPTFLKPCIGLRPPKNIWCHISGTDLVRDIDGTFRVLEDNAQCPSGVSYVLENRQVMKRTFPQIFERMSIRPVDDYPARLLEVLRFLAPDHCTDPTVVVLTPGRFNSAYFEHAFLAQQMGVELVEPQDLVVRDRQVQMKTTSGLAPVHVVYRRVSADFLDPRAFRPDSLLGVPGIMDAYIAGNVALANAPGTGVADDKAVYAYVEKLIKYYLKEDAILSNVPTYLCTDDKERSHVLAHLDKLVVKATDGAGGYGMLVGPHSTKEEQVEFASRIQKNPRGYIAQPTLNLSRAPTMINGDIEPRHVDLRPFVLYGKDVYVQPGGLTRVALRKGSLVVNSSQGGGSKDTWVLAKDAN